MENTGQAPERAKYDNGLRRKLRLLVFWACDWLPVSRFLRARLYRKMGVAIEPGVVRLGRVTVDTLHPEDIHIGCGSAIANGVVLLSHFYDPRNLAEHAYYRGPIHIGRNCYVASNVVFAKPVTVGDGAIVGAGSVVTKDIPPYEVWAGAPARFISRRCPQGCEPKDTAAFKPR